MLEAATDKDYQIINISGFDLWLLPDKAIYIPKTKTLLIADVHLGKATHFRQQGLSVPSLVLTKDISRLDNILSQYQIERIIILGDLFHAKENKEWEIFGSWVLVKHNIKFILIKGNHDRLSFEAYGRYGITIHENMLVESPFVFIHQPFENEDDIKKDHYAFAGHVHPATTITGKGRQTIQVECFCFYPRQAILPAFGSFTGTHVICKSNRKAEFVIAGNRVIKTF